MELTTAQGQEHLDAITSEIRALRKEFEKQIRSTVWDFNRMRNYALLMLKESRDLSENPELFYDAGKVEEEVVAVERAIFNAIKKMVELEK